MIIEQNLKVLMVSLYVELVFGLSITIMGNFTGNLIMVMANMIQMCLRSNLKRTIKKMGHHLQYPNIKINQNENNKPHPAPAGLFYSYFYLF
nr:MAG TPA: hypothetical protein [Caudoviricetes sp.]